MKLQLFPKKEEPVANELRLKAILQKKITTERETNKKWKLEPKVLF